MAKQSDSWLKYVILIVGIFMLGQNLAWWSFWNIEAWTSAFILYALSKIV